MSGDNHMEKCCGHAATAVPVAMAKCRAYSAPAFESAVFNVLEHASLPPLRGMLVLVKPNLLQPKELACTSPPLVAALCRWLLDQGARPEIADSPGFGRAKGVARAIGLDSALAPLGLSVQEMGRARKVPLELPPPWDDHCAHAFIAQKALDCDIVFSVPRIKAHSQMLVSLAVKNCFGVIAGLRKAIVHAREGAHPALFAAFVAALFSALPPVAALSDGVVAMQGTGPSKGQPCSLGLLAASSSAELLDLAILDALRIDWKDVPLCRAMAERVKRPEMLPVTTFPMEKPCAWHDCRFSVPAELAHTSFMPGRLVKSCARRILATLKP